MNSIKVYLKTIFICIILGLIIFGVYLKKIERISINTDPLKFDQNNAHQLMTKLSKDFKYRVTYSEPRKKAAIWLKEVFKSYGYTPKGMQFSEVINGKTYNDLENIYAEKIGTKYPDQIIVISAHYDIAETTIEGAMDDAAGIGIILELAKIYSKEESERTLLFLLTDSEELGAFWGAHNFVRQFNRKDQIIADINIDYPSPEKQVSILTLCDGLREGYTPLWLREMAMDSVRSVNRVKAIDFTNVMEHIERALLIPPADHGEFLAMGIPAFNYVGQPEDYIKIANEYHHTPKDTAEALTVEAIGDVGTASERLIRSLNDMSALPENFRNSSYWKITENRFIEGWVVTLLHTLAFIPFLFFSILRFREVYKNHSHEEIKKISVSEFKNVLILLGSMVVGYVIMLLLPQLHLITQYEQYPATQKAPLLYNPNFIAIACVILAVLALYYIFKKLFFDIDDDLDFPEIRQSIQAFLFSILITIAMFKNSYLATLLLLPPAYFWMGLKVRRRLDGKILNFLLILGGTVTFLIILLVMSHVFHIGVVYWYIFLGISYGLFSAYAVILFFLALAIIIRQLKRYVFK